MGRLLDENNVIDALEKVASFFPYRIPGKGETYDKYNEAWNDAIGRAEMEIESLPSAQQEPKSPLYYGDGYSEGKMVYDSAECPNCGYIYDEGDHVWGEPYCPHCGQALDWYTRGEQDE